MKPGRNRRASSLVATLLVLVVLSTIVVAFMQSMAIERMTSKSARNSLQAELATEAGVEAAKSQLLELFSRYPDSVTAWQNIPSGAFTNQGTVFYFRAQPGPVSANALPAATSASVFNPTPGTISRVQSYAWPLISGANPVVATNITNSFPSGLTSLNSTDLNFDNWIGTAPNQPRKILKAQWIYLTNSQGATNARYAFWVEDESFKANIALAQDGVRGTSTPGVDAREVPLQGVLSLASGVGSNEIAGLVNLRGLFGETNLLSFRTAGQAFLPSGTSSVGEQLKFVATAHSGALNLSRDGWKRVNINSIFTNAVPVRDQIDRFISTVTNSNASPLFGQRFYRQSFASPLVLNATNSVTSLNALIYLNKLGANVKDYIDADNNPTLINNDFSVRTPGPPTEALEPEGGGTEGANPVIAFGKEIVPMLHEYAFHVRLKSMVPVGWSGTNTGAAFNMEIDHYLEYWNMGTKDIVVSGSSPTERTLGTNSFLKIYNQPGFGAGANGTVTPELAEGRPINIQLSSIPNLRFKAGKVTVITTAPSPNASLIKPGAEVFIAPVALADRVYSGTTTDYSTDNAVSGTTTYNNSYRVLHKPRSNTQNDYESCVLLGNDAGILDSFCALPIVSGGSGLISVMAKTASQINSDVYWVRGGSLRGNSGGAAPVTTTGDPRSLNEQLRFLLYTSGTDPDQTRFYESSFVDGSSANSSSIGNLNSNFVNPNVWSDYTLNSSSATDAPMIIANANMASIGELGNIYDPTRAPGTTGTTNSYVRGGGLTLQIGQPNAWSSTTNRTGHWDGRWDSASRTWAAWRLTDFFSTTSADFLPGVININGVRRDGGVALKALLTGFAYQTSAEGDPTLAGIAPNASQFTNLVSAITNRLNGVNVATPADDFLFWERGEISELPLFHTNTTLAGVNMGNVLDRGREEMVRRMINIVTTKGSVYSVYVVGQAIAVDSSGNIKVLARSRRKQTLQVQNDEMSSQVDTFDPSVASEVTDRFRANTNFQTKSIWNSQE